MRHVLEKIEGRARDYDELPLFAFMRDERIDPRARLAFAPGLAHFVMTFSDLYAHVLRDEPARDRYQELVNAHTYEDGGHWKWFLTDLARLGQDPMMSFSDSLRFVWSDATIQSRLLSYHMCRLGFGASSIRKLVLVHCIEATGKVSLRNAAPLARELAARGGKNLVYFGPHHFDTEKDHTLEEKSVHDWLERVELDPSVRAELCTLVDEAFDAFVAFSNEIHRYAQSAYKTQQS